MDENDINPIFGITNSGSLVDIDNDEKSHGYNKKVIYHNIDYWEEDHGLRVRKWDIDNDFDSLHLKDNDNIIEILKGII